MKTRSSPNKGSVLERSLISNVEGKQTWLPRASFQRFQRLSPLQSFAQPSPFLTLARATESRRPILRRVEIPLVFGSKSGQSVVDGEGLESKARARSWIKRPACVHACVPACLSIDVGTWKRIIKRVKIIVFPSSVQFRPSWKRGSLARLIISFRKTTNREEEKISKSFVSSQRTLLPRGGGQLLP